MSCVSCGTAATRQPARALHRQLNAMLHTRAAFAARAMSHTRAGGRNLASRAASQLLRGILSPVPPGRCPDGGGGVGFAWDPNNDDQLRRVPHCRGCLGQCLCLDAEWPAPQQDRHQGTDKAAPSLRPLVLLAAPLPSPSASPFPHVKHVYFAPALAPSASPACAEACVRACVL